MAEWKRRDRVDGDPVWFGSAFGLKLIVSVECEWFWGWEVCDGDDTPLADGVLMIEERDGAWDYQGIELAQARCEAVAKALNRGDGTEADSPQFARDHEAMEFLRGAEGGILDIKRPGASQRFRFAMWGDSLDDAARGRGDDPARAILAAKSNLEKGQS